MTATPSARQEVVVVTGGALGIGAAISDSLARAGAFVVVVDPGVTVDGHSLDDDDATATATDGPVGDAGGAVRRSRASVTDRDAIAALFSGVRDEFGALDVVINAAGITRPLGFGRGTEDDWASVLAVHLDGYLNVLRAALPIMADAGHGRILGVTSGAGWRPADAGAYSCAKRAVAALTWQVGRVAPSGVTVDALSPIALTRMVTGAGQRQAPAPQSSSGATTTGGLSLSAMPPPEHLGPVGAFLAGPRMRWSSGNIWFSNGAELAAIAPPRVVEAVRSIDTASLRSTVARVVPTTFVAAERAQVTTGASNVRFADLFDVVDDASIDGAGQRCAVVTDDEAWAASLDAALGAHGATTITASKDVARGFDGAAAQLADLVDQAGGPLDAVVVVLADRSARGGTRDGWEQVLDDHDGTAEHIVAHAAWMHAVADHSATTQRPVRIATVTEAAGPGGRSAAQAAAQLARAAHGATDDRVDVYPVSVESRDDARRAVTAELAALLLCHDNTGELSGAELVVAPAWFGLRSHPRATGSITFGGPDVPDWVDDLLPEVATWKEAR